MNASWSGFPSEAASMTIQLQPKSDHYNLLKHWPRQSVAGCEGEQASHQKADEGWEEHFI